ncbi:MAG TPA: putative sulfate exporter family transporter, partial [Ignavibacteria bacterium]
IYFLARKGLVITLFLIGAGLSIDKIKSVGLKPIVQGIILWFLISIISLVVIRQTI